MCLRRCVRMFVLAPIMIGVLAVGANAQGASPGNPKDSVVVYPEKTVPVEVSSTDVNRIVCPDEPTEIVYSQEKGMIVTASGRNLFVKFSVAKTGKTKQYNKTTNELFISVGDTVYSLILYPRQIPTQNVWLSPPKVDRWKALASRFSGLPEEEKIVRFIKAAYRDRFPEEGTLIGRNKPMKNAFPGLDVNFDKEFEIDGQGMRVKVFTLRNTRDKPMQLYEKLFMKPSFSSRPIAVCLEKIYLDSSEVGRLFIVERVKQDGDGNG